jgi:hypothetical protein
MTYVEWVLDQTDTGYETVATVDQTETSVGTAIETVTTSVTVVDYDET